MLKEPNRMYGVAAEIKPPFKLDEKLVVQYESTLTDGLTCGGAYIKLLESPVDTSKFDNESPYVLMFGTHLEPKLIGARTCTRRSSMETTLLLFTLTTR